VSSNGIAYAIVAAFYFYHEMAQELADYFFSHDTHGLVAMEGTDNQLL